MSHANIKIIEPLDSLIRKSEKARQKLPRGTWQHTMLGNNIAALYLALALIRDESPAHYPDISPASAIDAFISMIRKTENALPKFTSGTSQNTLLRNRLKALREGEAKIRTKMKTEPNQALQTMTTAVTDCAAHTPRQLRSCLI